MRGRSDETAFGDENAILSGGDGVENVIRSGGRDVTSSLRCRPQSHKAYDTERQKKRDFLLATFSIPFISSV